MVNVLYDPVARGVISSPIAGETVAFILAGLLLILVVGIALTIDRDALPTQVRDAARRINAAIRESMERFPGAWRGTPGRASGHLMIRNGVLALELAKAGKARESRKPRMPVA